VARRRRAHCVVDRRRSTSPHRPDAVSRELGTRAGVARGETCDPFTVRRLSAMSAPAGRGRGRRVRSRRRALCPHPDERAE
jgi:hypothetical protein